MEIAHPDQTDSPSTGERDGADFTTVLRVAWLQPRRAMRHLLDLGFHDGDVILGAATVTFAVAVLAVCILRGATPYITIPVGMLLPAIAFLSVAFSLPALMLFASLVGWTGRCVGGRGEARELQAAIVLSSLPIAYSLPFWIGLLVLYGAGAMDGKLDGAGLTAGRVMAAGALLVAAGGVLWGWVGRRGAGRDLESSFALPALLLISFAPLWATLVLVVGRSQIGAPFAAMRPGLVPLFVAGPLGLLLCLWSGFLCLMMIAEAHRCGIWRAGLALFLASLVPAGVASCVAVVVRIAMVAKPV